VPISNSKTSSDYQAVINSSLISPGENSTSYDAEISKKKPGVEKPGLITDILSITTFPGSLSSKVFDWDPY
jgi:hypothetical protein